MSDNTAWTPYLPEYPYIGQLAPGLGALNSMRFGCRFCNQIWEVQGWLSSDLRDLNRQVLESFELHRHELPKPFRHSTVQDWVSELPMMQQAVLLAAIRGPDGVSRSHPSKKLVKFYRRCILYSAFDSADRGEPVALLTPAGGGGGSFTGPSIPGDVYNDGTVGGEGQRAVDWLQLMVPVVKDYIDARDELPAHYQGHFMHAVEVLGYKHADLKVRAFWHDVYKQLAMALHLNPETEEQLDHRLGDSKAQWRSVQVETYQGR